MAKYVMAFDAGTTSSRCILFDQAGRICSVAQKEFRQIFPKPGWVEHDANEIWSTQLGVAVEAMNMIGACAADIAAIGITNQRETAIVWDPEILKELDIPVGMLPKPMPSSCVCGYTDEAFPGGEIPIARAAGDQQAALFGQTCFHEGEVKNTYGTGCFLLMNTGRQPVFSKNGLVTTIAWGIDGKVSYALEGFIFVAGAAIQWLRDELCLIDSAAESEELACRVENTNGCYVVPAFTGLGAPYWEPYARGTIVGLTRGTNKAHIVRATLESIALSVCDVVDAMREDAGMDLQSLKVDGGACANNLLMQMQADLLGISVSRPECVESTALGAAYLAGLAVGYWNDREELIRNQCIQRVFAPAIEEQERNERLGGWKKAVGYACGWAKEEDE